MVAAVVKTAEEEENAKRKAARKRRNERVANDLRKISMTAVMTAATTKPEGVPLAARKLRCISKKMKRTWRMSERGKKFYSTTILLSNEPPTTHFLSPASPVNMGFYRLRQPAIGFQLCRFDN